jgi:hypothetical protein
MKAATWWRFRGRSPNTARITRSAQPQIAEKAPLEVVRKVWVGSFIVALTHNGLPEPVAAGS